VPLAQKQPLEHPKVIQQPAASVDVPGQPIELVSDELQRLETPCRGLLARSLRFLRHGFFCGLDRFAQQTDVLEGSLDAIERRAFIGHGAILLSDAEYEATLFDRDESGFFCG
jgi:hypothetical protein